MKTLASVPNNCMQRRGPSRSRQRQIERQRRLAPITDADRWPLHAMKRLVALLFVVCAWLTPALKPMVKAHQD